MFNFCSMRKPKTQVFLRDRIGFWLSLDEEWGVGRRLDHLPSPDARACRLLAALRQIGQQTAQVVEEWVALAKAIRAAR